LIGGLIVRVQIPRGNFLCLSPYWSHRDEALYDNANEWDPGRFNNTTPATCSKVRFGNLAFGNGTYRCPGKFFAQLELNSLLALILRTFTLELAVGQQVPDIDRQNLVGVTKPANDARVTLKYRNPNNSNK
jgi:cytochrome P450